MVRVKYDLPKAVTDANPAAPAAIRKEVGQRIYRAMIKRGWSQAELARQSGMARNNVSTYIRGAKMPTRESAEKLARALGVHVNELVPSAATGELDEVISGPAFAMTEVAPGVVMLRINRRARLATAVQIADLLQRDDVAD